MSRRTRPTEPDWAAHRADEKVLVASSPHGEHPLALAYPNTYFVGMSSLGFQRVWELVHAREGWSAERYFSDGQGTPRSVETERPLEAHRLVAFSVSFEEDYLNLLGMLDRARIPLRRRERTETDPLVLMGGSCAAINPLPMSEFVDVFALGAGENLLAAIQTAHEELSAKAEILERLAGTPGFYVPAHHRPEEDEELPKLRKLELTGEQMATPGNLPTTAIVTPRTEFRDKFLVEMSRGCPEKCKYCWATFGMGSFRFHPTDAILAALERARSVTDQVGFVATAVGDHPEIGRILREADAAGFRAAVSSIRIPAVTPDVLEPLRRSGAGSITLAPETGSDALRFKMNKPIPNAVLLEKVRLIFEHGFRSLKLYFIVGMPGETDEDVDAIAELAAECRALGAEVAPRTGVMPEIQLGVNVLIPKPYTPWQREAMVDEKTLKAKIRRVRRGVGRLPNVSMTAMSPRQAAWQTYLSRAGSDAAEAIERAARGAPLSVLLRDYRDRIHPEVYREFPRRTRWHFLRMG